MTAIDRPDYPDADYACPVLPSLNLDETETWYVKLRFVSLQVCDVDAYDTAWRPHVSAPARIGSLENKPRGMREFPLWDAHGNLFRVGSPIQSG